MLMATGCTESEPEYTPAPACPSLDVYFSAANNPSIRALDGDTKFSVNVYRSDKEEAKSYALTCKDATDASLFTVPAEVSFAAGENLTSFDVTYVAENLEGIKPYNMTFVIGEGENTPYALQTVTYTVTYFPWEDVVGPNGEEYGLWKDDILTVWFDLPETALEWEVKVQRSPAINGLYRIVNPYGTAAFPGIRFPNGSFASGGTIDGLDHYLYFNCADPTHIFVCDEDGQAISNGRPIMYNTGADLGYGTVYITGDYNFEMADGNLDKAMTLAGTLTNGVIKFPEKALLVAMTNHQNGSFYYTNGNGAFRILFPGAEEEKDPDDVWENIGAATFTDPWITPLYGAAETWNVEVEQWKKDPNMYRLVNPYKDGVMTDGWNYEGDKYFVFDATNPECVKVEDQEIFYDEGDPVNGSIIGLNLGYALQHYVETPWTDTQIISDGANDTFANQTFTFREGDALFVFPNSSNTELKGAFQYSDAAGSLVLNSETAATAAANRRSFVARKALLNPGNGLPEFRYETRVKTFYGPKMKVSR